MKRTPEMDRALAKLFPCQSVRKADGLCATCAQPIGEFRDELSRNEFAISGLCQACQDQFFKESEK